jgi:hypothetical protein
MNALTFDRWTVAMGRRPTRRTALRLLAGSLIGGVLTTKPARAAQGRPDRDNDGLYDDDETNVYGTNPDNPDSDCDGVQDGPEIYYGTDPLGPPGCAPTCPSGQARCGGVCIDVTADPYNCGGCGAVCGAGLSCIDAVCLAPAPSSDERCIAQGLTACSGFCTNTWNDSNNCGACGNSCPLGSYCEGGVCLGGCAGRYCGGVCVDTSSDGNNCGACGNVCQLSLTCCNGGCVNLSNDVNNCGACGAHCFIPIIGDPTCEGGVCNP